MGSFRIFHRRSVHTLQKLHRPLAVLFPGQGSQYVGMAKHLCDHFPSAKRIVDIANHVLKFNLSELMFVGPKDELTRTIYAQPAILTCSAAILAVLKDNANFDLTKHSDYVIGHSLGEYTALYAAGALCFEDALRLVSIRGKAMEDCMSNKNLRTNMVAVICQPNKLHDVINHVAEIKNNGQVVSVSNVNSSTQIVLSGTHELVEETCKSLHHKGLAMRAIELPVSAPFHCNLMLDASVALRSVLFNTKFNLPLIPVLSNVTVTPYTDCAQIPKLLENQITHTVNWHFQVQYLRSVGRVRDFMVIGPNRVLGNLLRKDWPTDRVLFVDTLQEVNAIIKNSTLVGKVD